jgi:hypothetical protein
MIILVTATKVHPTDSIIRVLGGIHRKYPDAMIGVGNRDVHLHIAEIAASVNMGVTFFYEDVASVHPPALDVAMQIIIATARSFTDFNSFVIERIDSVVAFDENDPLAILARRRGKNIWYPLSGEVVRGS